MHWVILNFSVCIKGTNGFTHTPWWVCQSDLGSLIQIILKEGTLSVFFANRCNTTVSLAYDHYNYSIILITPEQYCLARKFSPHKYHFWKQSIVNSVAIVKPTLILVDTRQRSVKIILCCESESWQLLSKSFTTQTCLMSSHFAVCLLVWKTNKPNHDEQHGWLSLLIEHLTCILE